MTEPIRVEPNAATGAADAVEAADVVETTEATELAPVEPEATAPPPLAEGREGQELAAVHFVAEYWPYARSGGLAEAVRGIATFQAASDIPVAVFMPLYREVREAYPELRPVWGPYPVPLGGRTEQARLLEAPGPPQNPRVLFVEHAGFFDRDGIYGEDGDYPDNHLRFGFFNLAALLALPDMANVPVVVHAHDWHAALAPVYLRTVLSGQKVFDRMASILSIHNAGYQGHFDPQVLLQVGLPARLFHWEKLEWYGQLNWLKGGLVFADYVTTVSPTHATELRTPAGGFGLHHSFIGLGDRFSGIRNGIDLDVWNPATDAELVRTFSVEDLSGKALCKREIQRAYGLAEAPRKPLFGMTARLVGQKGLDLILGDELLLRTDAQFVFLGAGEPRYEKALAELAAAAPDRIAVEFKFREPLEHQLLGGADLLLMPSQYEPCGLTQMRAQRYGALPVARRVGGLADTIDDQLTGFLFDEYTTEGLERAIGRAIATYKSDPEAWREHMVVAMGRDFGWGSSAEQYLDVYRRALRQHAAGARAKP